MGYAARGARNKVCSMAVTLPRRSDCYYAQVSSTGYKVVLKAALLVCATGNSNMWIVRLKDCESYPARRLIEWSSLIVQSVDKF